MTFQVISWINELMNTLYLFPLLMSCYLISADEVFCQPHWQQHHSEEMVTRNNHRDLAHSPRTGDYPSLKNTSFVLAMVGGCAALMFLLYLFGGPCIFFPLSYLGRRLNLLCNKIKKCVRHWFGSFKSESEESLPVFHPEEHIFQPQHMVTTPYQLSKGVDVDFAAHQNV